MRKFRVCAKQEGKNGKAYWPEIGMTLFLKDDGKMSLLDARTGQFYSVFEIDNKKKDGDMVKESFSGEDVPF